jgi:hypothetical protein
MEEEVLADGDAALEIVPLWHDGQMSTGIDRIGHDVDTRDTCLAVCGPDAGGEHANRGRFAKHRLARAIRTPRHG